MKKKLFTVFLFLFIFLLQGSLVFADSRMTGSLQDSAAREKGRAIFSENCAACHILGEGDDAIPDLKDVILRRTKAWLKNFILSPSQMFKTKDPIAMELLGKYKEPMSDPGLSADDVDVIVEYLAGLESSSDVSVKHDAMDERSNFIADAGRGRSLFQGKVRFSRGGVACISCHDIRNISALGGGRLSKDLTNSYARLGAARIHSLLEKSPSSIMKAAYQNNPLTADEISDLTALFLEEGNKEKAGKRLVNFGPEIFLIGFVGLVMLLGLYNVFWPNRKSKSVNKDIYDRQIKTK